jgi:hypothetical protein
MVNTICLIISFIFIVLGCRELFHSIRIRKKLTKAIADYENAKQKYLKGHSERQAVLCKLYKDVTGKDLNEELERRAKERTGEPSEPVQEPLEQPPGSNVSQGEPLRDSASGDVPTHSQS